MQVREYLMDHSESINSSTHKIRGFVFSFFKKQVLQHLQKIKGAQLTLKTATNELVFGDVNSDLKVLMIVHTERFYTDVALHGSVGAAESYIAGDWDCDHLTRLIQVFVRNRELLDGMEGGSAKFKNALLKIGHFFNKNTPIGSRKNIAGHYDLGNDLFEQFLDSRMMYSSAIYQNKNESLEVASERKLRTICEKLQLCADDHVIEIGTGWGGFAIYAAQNYGCNVTTTTISEQQYSWTKEKINNLGLSKQITLLKQDYRLLHGQYDKLVSIEMIEAVGHHYLQTYLKKCHDLLKSDGLALIQAITIEEHRYKTALHAVDFIKKYIFPGSFIPSVGAILTANAAVTDMKLVNLEDFGDSYAYTLNDWQASFKANMKTIEQCGYDKAFQRMWCFYLSYCEGGFIERAISDVQLLLAKPQNKRAAILAFK